MPTLHVISFGYGHNPAPAADLVVDVRNSLRNPHHDPAMRELTGLSERVYEHVISTPGAEDLARDTLTLALHLAETTNRDVTVAWGCVGGRHRSVGLARLTHTLALADGRQASLTHRDVERPVLASRHHA
ncbi:RNase adapter RapZ [Streptomyces lavendulae]|uniref:RapZ C-terminal domain-containing protein n=1 Tax=Streptomyces lavendulae TaxID=1914 RepID=UPI0033F28D12